MIHDVGNIMNKIMKNNRPSIDKEEIASTMTSECIGKWKASQHIDSVGLLMKILTVWPTRVKMNLFQAIMLWPNERRDAKWWRTI